MGKTKKMIVQFKNMGSDPMENNINSLIKNGISPSKANKLSIMRGTHTQCIALFVGFW
tara:strand:+ start:57 stop:230 length:174 start_codon:yes stop_codon:yes gene_type:complete